MATDAEADGVAESTTTTTSPVLLQEDTITRQRECPVPKPGGLLGQVMGFERQERERPMVVVKALREKRRDEEIS